MSRCFPYPPPRYTGNRGINEALIESIKLQREREQAKAERKKEKKREKKEKKKENKEKKAKQNASHSTYDDKTNKVEKSWAGVKDVYLQKVKEDENEQLERSGLTEEHEQPICSQNPSSSSDSTQNSSKRKRHTSSAVVEREENVIRGHGNVIRIRLSSQKHKAVDASVPTKRQKIVDTPDRSVEPCSTSGRTDLPAQQHKHIAPGAVQGNLFPTPLPTNFVSGVLPPRHDRVCSTSGRTETLIKDDIKTAPGYKKPEKKLSKAELKYKDLIENWIPSPLQTELGYDDQDWLVSKKNPVNQAEKKLKASDNLTCCSSSTLWPRAQFLPEADIYALPFTVPF